MTPGYTFTIRGTDYDPPTLWVIASEPDESGRVVVVPIRPVPRKIPCDMTCVIEANYHPVVTRKSFADYEKAKWLTPEHQEIALQHSDARDTLDPGLLKKLMKGAVDSDFTPEGQRAHIASCM